MNKVSFRIACAPRLRFLLLVWFTAMATDAQAEKENLIDRQVTTIRWDAEFRSKDNTVIGTSELGKTYKVYAVDGKKLFVRESDGYLMRNDVVPYETARKHFDSIVKKKPSASTYYDRGSFLGNEGESDAAIQDYGESLKRNSKQAHVYNARGGVFYYKGELDKAIADFTKSLELEPNDPVTLANRGSAWADKGDDNRGLKDLNAAIDANPEYATAYEYRGQLWVRRREFAKALDDFGAALRLDPTNPDPLLNRGEIYRMQREFKKSVADFSEMLRRDPKNESALYNRAQVWADQGIYISAVADLEQLTEINPQMAEAWTLLAWIRASCSDPVVRNGKKAMEAVEKLKSLVQTESSLEYHETLAAAHAALGEFDKAVEWQSKTVANLAEKSLKGPAEERLKLYESRKPYELPIVQPKKD